MSEEIEFVGAHGLRLVADAQGEQEAPVVLLLHGGGQTRHAWGGTADVLAACGYRAIRIDARGHGESDWDPGRRYRLEHYVEDLLEVARSFPVVPAVVGASLGGLTALCAAGLHGLAIPALVLVDVAPKLEVVGVQRIHEFMRRHPDGFEAIEEVADAVAGYIPHRARPSDTSGLEKNLRRGENGRWYWHWDPAFLEVMFQPDAAGAQEDTERAARQLSSHTLLVRGRLSDLLSEEGARHFCTLAPHAELVDVSGAAHMIAGDKNDRFTEAITSFLERRYPTNRVSPFIEKPDMIR